MQRSSVETEERAPYFSSMAATSQVNIRCTDEQHARWSAAAKRAKRKLADWARLQIDKGAGEEMLEDSSATKAGKGSPGPRR